MSDGVECPVPTADRSATMQRLRSPSRRWVAGRTTAGSPSRESHSVRSRPTASVVPRRCSSGPVDARISSGSDVAAQVSGLPVLPIGRGSNMLVADAGFHGIAVSLVDLAEHLEMDTAGGVVTTSAGMSLPVLARKTAASGLTGFEWAVGVPGSIGGAVRMNAGGHGSDMAESLVDVTVVDLAGRPTTVGREAGGRRSGIGVPAQRAVADGSGGRGAAAARTGRPRDVRAADLRDRARGGGRTSPGDRTPGRCSSTPSPAR